MQIRPSTRMRAVLDIYRAQRKPRGGTLSRVLLQREWKKTGLRRSDLDEALRDLTQRHMLQLRSQPLPVYELTYLGECAGRLPEWGLVNSLRDRLTLLQARSRRPDPTRSPMRRRLSDTG